MQRILILSCSKKKTLTRGLIPAIERYDGPVFRVIRRYLRFSGDSPDIYILSSKFGLIPHTRKIFYYDSSLTINSAEKMRDRIYTQAQKLFLANSNIFQKQFFVNLGKNYQKAFLDVFDDLQSQTDIICATGSSGNRLAKLYDWLYSENSPLRNEPRDPKIQTEVFLRGIRFQANETVIYKIVQNEIIQNGTNDWQCFHSWFVPINDLKISPKWIVSQLTGLPVSKFHSDEARKALQKLGIKVQRV